MKNSKIEFVGVDSEGFAEYTETFESFKGEAGGVVECEERDFSNFEL